MKLWPPISWKVLSSKLLHQCCFLMHLCSMQLKFYYSGYKFLHYKNLLKTLEIKHFWHKSYFDVRIFLLLLLINWIVVFSAIRSRHTIDQDKLYWREGKGNREWEIIGLHPNYHPTEHPYNDEWTCWAIKPDNKGTQGLYDCIKAFYKKYPNPNIRNCVITNTI